MEWLTPTNVIALIAAVLSGVGGSALVKGWLDRKKTSAEAKNLDITGDMSLGKGWQEYAEQQRKDKEELRKEFKEEIEKLKKEFAEVLAAKDGIIRGLETANATLKEQNIILNTQNTTLNEANEELTQRVEDLLTELGRYKGMEGKVDEAAGKLHTEIDKAAEEIKHPVKDKKTHG